MKRIGLLFVAMFAVMLGGCERSEDSIANASSPVQVVRADFGVFNMAENGTRAFVPSNTVPLTVGQPFGWVVLLKTKRSKVRWREELILPSAPERWGGSPRHYTVSPDRRVAATEREVEPDADGMIFNVWYIAPGDPKGHHMIRLAIDGASPMVFEFDVD